MIEYLYEVYPMSMFALGVMLGFSLGWLVWEIMNHKRGRN